MRENSSSGKIHSNNDQLFAVVPSLIRGRLGWLNQRNLPMITHNDLDGLLSALLLHKFLGWKLVGTYDLEKLWLSKDFKGNVNDAIFVDLDIADKNCRSIGHHIINLEDGEGCNINQLFNVSYEHYTQKFPLSTALMLHWLFEKELPTNEMGQLFLLHTDSTWMNFVKYNKNVVSWLDRLNFNNNLLPLLQDPTTAYMIKQSVFPKTYGWNKQCSFSVSEGQYKFSQVGDVQAFVDEVATYLECESIQLPTDLVQKASYEREERQLPDGNLIEALNAIKTEKEIFSYSLKYRNVLDLSFAV